LCNEKPFPEPHGNVARVMSLSIKPLTHSLTVPSPPATITLSNSSSNFLEISKA